MKIGIVDDSMIAVESLRRVLSTRPEHRIIWVARNGAEGVKLCAEERPELILMDLMMPVMDGVLATRKIMESTPCAILIVTSTVSGHSSKVFEAMGAGALDAVATPVIGRETQPVGGEELLKKIERIGKILGVSDSKKVRISKQPEQKASIQPHSDIMVAIGCSTGGPKSLVEVLTPLPKNFPAAIVVIQHMDEKFTAGMVDWIDSKTSMKVRVARNGDRPQPGTILFACTDNHLVMTADNSLKYVKEPVDNFYHPSVDVFFHSIAQYWNGKKGVAALLTGMGRDGANGLLALRKLGWHTIAQDEASSVVYGMPKAAKEIDAAVEILPIDRISQTLVDILMPKKNNHE